VQDSLRDLLTRGIAAAKAGQAEEARFFLDWLLRSEPPMADLLEAWYWLAEVNSDPVEKRRCLEEVLARDPANPRARRALAILDGRLKPEEIVDPDRLTVPAAAQSAAEARRFTCPKCGGRMVYAPDGQALICEQCARREARQGARAARQDFTIAMATARGHRVPVASRSFDCQGCGTPFVLGPAVMSVTCPYCGSAHVVDETNTRELVPPDGLIPFRLGAAQAAGALHDWLEREKLEVRVEPPQGMYLPVWAFDLAGQVPWSGLRYDSHRRGWVAVSGVQFVLEDDVGVAASDRLPTALLGALETFDLRQARPYDPAYLADWPAETYQRTMSDAALIARQRVFARCRERVGWEQGGEIKDLSISSAGMAIDSYRLILVPLWLSAFDVQGRRCRVAVNGADGTVRGEAPRSGVREWLGKVFGES